MQSLGSRQSRKFDLSFAKSMTLSKKFSFMNCNSFYSESKASCDKFSQSSDLKTGSLGSSIHKQLRTLKNMYEYKLKNVKVKMMKEMQDELHKKSSIIMKEMTGVHRKLIEQFIDFKVRTEDRMKYMDDLEETNRSLIHLHALMSPTRELNYGIDVENPLRMYDCMIPVINTRQALQIQERNMEIFKRTRERLARERAKG